MVGQNIGKYRVLDRIGRGGMGTVYRALDETLHREVAIKVLNAELNDPEVARRFRAEAVTVARLNHPGIATIFELFQNDGQWLMVMEYVRGETLERMVDRLGPQSPQRAADLLMQALSALAHAHSQGVVHRDLKPANLMSTEAGAVKIMDFGIARVTGSEHLTSAGFMMGTPAYMAPEQVLGQEIDARTDLYALGVVFYFLLSGKLPFKGETPIAMAQSRINDQPTPLHNVREGLPPWLEPVLERALAKQPEARFQTADLFREALRRGLAGLPMDATASAPTELIQTTPSNAMPIVRQSASTPPSTPVDATMPLGSTAPTILRPSPTPAASEVAPPPVASGSAPAPPAAKSVEAASKPAAAKSAEANVAPAQASVPAAAGAKAPARSTPAPAADRKAPAAASATSKATAAPKSNAGMLIGIAAIVLLAVGGGFWWMRHNAANNPAAPAADQSAAATSSAQPPSAPATPADANAAGSTTPQTPPADASNPAASAASTTTAPPAAGANTSGKGSTATLPSGTAPNTTSAAGTRGAVPPSSRGAASPTTPATPTPGDELVQFQDAKVLLIAGRRADDEDVTIQLGGGEVIVAPKKGGAPIASEPYSKLVRATFVHARDPRWESALPHPADSPLDLPGVFHPARNWLVLQSRTDFVILRLDDSNVSKVLDTIQTRAALTISRPAAGGGQ